MRLSTLCKPMSLLSYSMYTDIFPVDWPQGWQQIHDGPYAQERPVSVFSQQWYTNMLAIRRPEVHPFLVFPQTLAEIGVQEGEEWRPYLVDSNSWGIRVVLLN